MSRFLSIQYICIDKKKTHDESLIFFLSSTHEFPFTCSTILYICQNLKKIVLISISIQRLLSIQ